MKRPDLIVHGVIALAWVSCCFAIAIKIALLGNEAAAAGKQRGADFKARTELTYEQERLRAEFDQQACVPAIDQLVRTLDLPLQPPVVTAAVNRSP
jgi:hypothetical protein